MPYTQRLFSQFHSLSGGKTLSAIPPISSWVLPTGITYDRRLDSLIDSNNNVVDEDQSYYTATDVEYIQATNDETTKQMIAAGIIPDGSRIVYVKSSDFDTMNDSFAVEIDGDRYTVMSVNRINPRSGGIVRVVLQHNNK